MQDEPTSREDRWAHLADMVGMMVALFGAPAAIAAQRILLAATRIDILKWLAPLEALARRLLLLEAAELPPRNAPTARPHPGRIPNALRDTAAESADPTQWRVRFALWPHGHRRATPQREARAAQPAPYIKENALPLAKRIEALWRMIESRKHYVSRMANLLAARREKAYVAFVPFRHGGPVRDVLAQTQAEVEAALANTS